MAALYLWAAASTQSLVLQGSILDGHKLDVRLSLQKAATAKAAAEQAPKSAEVPKLLVRNVAFEATKKDIQALFTPLGQVKRCSLPRKFDGNHRCAWCLLEQLATVLVCEQR